MLTSPGRLARGLLSVAVATRRCSRGAPTTGAHDPGQHPGHVQRRRPRPAPRPPPTDVGALGGRGLPRGAHGIPLGGVRARDGHRHP